MSSTPLRSVQAESLRAFVGLKRAQGYRYTHQSNLLRRFDQFLLCHSYSLLWLVQEIVDG